MSLEVNVITEWSHVFLSFTDQQSCMAHRGSNYGVFVEESGKETFFAGNVNVKENLFANCFRRCW